MSVREYVGARYVPLFANPLDWDSTKTYEPLIVVYHLGNSYTSRQYVPAGIDISNTNYWALTGNYNAQIEQYRAEVQTFDGRITQNSNDIDSLQDDVTAIQAKEIVNVKDYGAVGNGITDDTLAFQTAINTGNDVYVPIDKGENYLISNTLNMSTSYQIIFSEPYLKISETASSAGILFSASTQSLKLFNVINNAFGVGFANLSIKQVSQNNYGIAIYADINDPSTDVKIMGCQFFNFYQAININGRGSLITDCAFTSNFNPIALSYTYSTNAHDNRATRISRNRFHVNEDICIRISSKIEGIIIDANIMDNGFGCFVDFESEVYDAIISNNYINNVRTECIRFRGITNSVNIFGNNFYNDLTNIPRNFIRFYVAANNTIINSNTFSRCYQHGIYFQSTADKVVITNNVFGNVCISAESMGQYNVIDFPNQIMNRVIIVGNSIQPVSGNSYAIGNQGANTTFNNCKFTLNGLASSLFITPNYVSNARSVIDANS